MKTNYEAPQIEVIEIEIEGAILIESTSEGSSVGLRGSSRRRSFR